MYDVVLLTLEDGPAGGCASSTPRVPVLACRDALVAGGARVETITAYSDEDIDAVLDKTDTRLIVAATTDGQVRAVVRRMVRRCASAPSGRPDSLPADRTLPDLPPIGLLPMGDVELVKRLGLASDPAEVAAAVLGGRARRLDLLRNDGGSVTLHGTLLGGSDDDGRAVPYAARVEVDDAVLTDGTEPLLATAVANADGYATVDDLPLVTGVDAADGVLDVAVALPVTTRRWYGRREVRVEVRRARGRAVAIHPRADVPFLDDGVAGTLGRKRTWWMERGAWAVFAA
ncbi:MAG TPA: diacylglycerol kinase family protein [Actinoplanes sp.]|nr:diacylglycerol kinase family protein [Actinoplanes sp.]